MNKKIILLVVLGGIFLPKAQVGINNSSPAATLDVTSKTTGATAGTPEGLISPRLTLLDLNQKSSAYTIAQTGTLIYVTDASNATPSGKTVNITTVGYYYFDGTLWQRMSAGSGSGVNNIYTNNGTLQANRIVAMNDKTLGFTVTTPSVNQFSVDGSLFSIDTQNDRVGVGTSTPQRTQHVNGSLQVTNELNVGGNATTAGSAGTAGQVLTSGGPGAAPTWVNAPVDTNTNIYNTDGTLTGNRTVTQGANTLAFTGTSANAFSVDGTTLSVDASGNRVGVGTSTPQRTQHVNGSLQVTNELNVGGNATTAGSAGTAGQVLTSGGPGAAPTWVNAPVDTNTNIYNTDGTLTGNRTVIQGANTLAFTGTSANAFSVDGTTLSVDASGNRVGVGTSTPQRTQHVNGSLQVTNELNVGGNATTAGSAGTAGQVLTSGGPGAAPTWVNAPVDTNTNIYNTDGTLTGNRTVTQGANTLAFTGTSANAFSVDGSTLSVDASGNRVGVGTSTPQRTQHVNGSLQVTNELNVGGNATTAGSAGTAGQVLTSGGPGAAPTWVNAPVDTNTNIYNTDGTLTGNRTVTQGANTLAFTGTSANAFSVDGSTLSVDAAGNRVGIGTTAPNRALEVNAASAPIRVTTLPVVTSTVPSSGTVPLVIDNTTGDIYQGKSSELLFANYNFITDGNGVNVNAIGGNSSFGVGRSNIYSTTFTITRPALVTISYNVATNFTNTSGGYIADTSIYISYVNLSLTNTTTNTVVQNSFGKGGGNYTNGVVSNFTVTGNIYNTAVTMIDLPAGSYRLDMIGTAGCASGRNVRVNFGGGGDDELIIRADYK